MVPAPCPRTAAVPPPAYRRALAKPPPALHPAALALVTTFHLLAPCRRAVRAAHRRCPPPLPKGPGGAPRAYREESLPLIALRRPLWRRSYQDTRDWRRAWPAPAGAGGLPPRPGGGHRVPGPSQQCKRAARAGAPPCAMLFVLPVPAARRRRGCGARDLIIASAPRLAWRRRDPDAAVGHAPAHRRGSGLPLFCVVAPANAHDAPRARLLLSWAPRRHALRPRHVRLAAADWGLTLRHWIHTARGAVAVVPWDPKRRKNRARPPPTRTREGLSKRGSIGRSFGRGLCFSRLQRPPVRGWTAVAQRVALTYAATIVVALAAQHAERPDLIRSPTRVLAHLRQDAA